MRTPQRVSAAEQDALLSGTTVTIPEAAKCFNVGESNFRGALRRGEINLPVISIGSRKVISTRAIRALLNGEV